MTLSGTHSKRTVLADSSILEADETAFFANSSCEEIWETRKEHVSEIERSKIITEVNSADSKEASLYLSRTTTLVRSGTRNGSSYGSPYLSELNFSNIKEDTKSKSRKPPVSASQREFTFTGYDIMADNPKPEEIAGTEEEKKRRENVHCYMSSCKRLGVTPSSFLSKHINDKNIVMKSHPLGPKGTRALCVALVNNNSVEKLDLEDNDIASEGALYIAEMLRENDTIVEVRLAENLIKSKGANAFVELLKSGSKLHTLDISGSGLEDSDADVLVNLIETKSQLQVLNVSHNGIGEHGALDIGRAIAINDTLRELDMSWNHIRGKGALAIALGIKKNFGLRSLNLAWNGFANYGTVAIGKALEKNRTLKSLDVSNNRIGLDGIKGLLKGLKQNEGISTLKIGQNPLSPEVALSVLMAIDASKKCVLTTLDMSDIVVRTDFLEKWDEIKRKRSLPLRIVFGAVMQATRVEVKNEEVIDWRDPVMRMFKFMHDKGYRIIDLLKRLDKDRSMSVDREELKLGLIAEKIPMTEAQLDEVITRLDTDKDGEVDMGELMKGEKEFRKKMKARMRKLLNSSRPDVALLKLMQIEDL